MNTTRKLAGAACAATLLIACGGIAPQQPTLVSAPPSVGAGVADGYYALGRKQYEERRYAEALRSYSQAARLDPRHLNARNGLAVLAAAQGDYARAIALWEELLKLREDKAGPDSAFLLGNLGYAYFLAGDRARAETALEQACLLDPLYAPGWEHLGQVLDAAGQPERAALMLRQAAALRSHDLRRDLARLPAGDAAPATARALAAAAAAPGVLTPEAWPPSPALARTEITPDGAAMVRVRQLAPVPEAGAPPAPARVAPAEVGAGPGQAAQAPLRLEISNGNGVTGMAARLARSLDEKEFRTVRLSNVKHFDVPVSRIEFQPERLEQARALATRLGLPVLAPSERRCAGEMRIVLGHDAVQLAQGGAGPQRYLK